MEATADFQKIIEFFDKYNPEEINERFGFMLRVTREFIVDAKELNKATDGVLSFYTNKYISDHLLDRLDGIDVTVYIDLELLRKNGFNIYRDWNAFLRRLSNRIKCPSRFYIIEDGSRFPAEELSYRVEHYLNIIGFVDVLLESCDFRPAEDRVVFIHKTTIEFELMYSFDAVEKGADGAHAILDMFKQDEHSGQKKSLLKEHLYNTLYSVKEAERFNHLLMNFGSFSSHLSQSFNLFVIEFSFDDIRREYEEKTRKYVAEINEVFSDVQARMLGVPAVLALAAFRFSTISEANQILPNLIIFVAVYIYHLMMKYLIEAQEDTLSSIEREMKSQIKRFKKDYKKSGRILELFEDNLVMRCSRQKNNLNKFRYMMRCLVIVVFCLFGASVYQNFLINSETSEKVSDQMGTRAGQDAAVSSKAAQESVVEDDTNGKESGRAPAKALLDAEPKGDGGD